MQLKAERIDTDLLVIGGGAAGCTAALTAHDGGARVTMIVKGLIGRSGCSIFAGNLNMPPKTLPLPLLSLVRKAYSVASRFVKFPLPRRYNRVLEAAIKSYMHYLVDQDYVLDAMMWAKRHFFPTMEAAGLYLLRYSDGTLVTNKGSGVPNMWAYKMGFSGVMFMEYKRKEVLMRRITVLEETMATRLLSCNGRIVGAMALDYAHGRLYVIRAKKTVLATGHTNWLAKRSTATREQSANGFAMAYRVGAEIQNIEIQWWHASDILYPRSWMRLHNYPNPMPGTDKQARLLNSDGEAFFDGTWYPTAVAPYFLQLKKLYLEVKRGKARWDGGYYTSYTHIEPEPLQKYQLHQSYYEKLGYDITNDPLESGITWHMTLGGVRADIKTMETKMPGLLVAGSVGGQYLGGIPFVSYDGTAAGAYAATSVRRMEMPALDEDQVSEEEERIAAILRAASGSDGVLPVRIKNTIREIMWDKMGYVKNEQKMKEALEQLRSVREETLEAMKLGTTTSNYNFDLVDALDVFDMLDTCEVTIHASLTRKESRGPFYREDFSYTDNENWLRFIAISKDNGKMKIETIPVKTKYIRPSKAKEDFFETDY